MNALTCLKCGVNRPHEFSMTLERPPCQNCGATSLTFTVSIEELVQWALIQCRK